MTKPWWTRALLGRTAVSNPLGAGTDDAPDAQFEAQWRSLIKKRLFPILAAMAAWVVTLEGRLVWVQAVDHDYWLSRAKNQQEETVPIYLPRGDLLDRHGRLLAYSVIAFEVHVNPKKAAEDRYDVAALPRERRKQAAAGNYDPASLAHELCVALSDCDTAEQSEILARLQKLQSQDVIIRRAKEMSYEANAGIQAFADRIEQAKRKTQELLDLRPRDVRYYPNVRMAAQVIGYVQTEDQADKTGKSARVFGKSGVERRFDEDLRGQPGSEFAQMDGHDKQILTTVIRPPKAGVSIELTLDAAIQEIAERALRDGIERAGAAFGTAVVLDSATGEVLAMASLPDYNLNQPGSVPGAELNHATQDLNEPGSTFKMVTLSAALDQGIVNAGTLIDTEGGRYTIAGRSKPITEDKGHNYGTLSVEGVLVRSSNIGAAKIGLLLGPDLMLRYAKTFGFAAPPKDHPSEFFSARFGGIAQQRGSLPTPVLATVSYGYGVEASPLQLVSAMNVFATGGVLMRPHLVHAVVEDGVRRVQEPEAIGRVIKPDTAATMVSMLEAVVDDPAGTGGFAKIARYRVAGKTGTTKKLTKAGYSESSYRVSFVGFVPSRHPRFSIIVVVDEPTKLPAYGGAVAAPIFKEIAERSLNYVGESPSVNPPPAVILSEERATGSRPSRPEPPAVLVNAGGVPTMPDLTGLTLRDALSRLPEGLTVTSEGDGVVVAQFPAAGEALAPDRVQQGVLRLQRAPAKSGGTNR